VSGLTTRIDSATNGNLLPPIDLDECNIFSYSNGVYRDFNEALQQRAETLASDVKRLERENEEMRLAVAAPSTQNPLQPFQYNPYLLTDVRVLPLAERARLANHGLTHFPVWAVGVLNVVTFGLFSLIHFGSMNDRLPQGRHNDPSAGKAIGFSFIPYYNLYWIFFNATRFCDRLTLQFRLRGLPDQAPKGLLIAASVLAVIPYLNIVIGLPILWTIGACFLQSSVNKIAKLPPASWDATPADAPPTQPINALLASPMGPQQVNALANLPGLSEQQLASKAKAQKLVNISHVLGWGGLGVMLMGSIAGAIVGGPAAAAMIGTLGFVSAIAGGIVGQVGRGMQGRAI
jgi:hypothetical protein